MQKIFNNLGVQETILHKKRTIKNVTNNNEGGYSNND